MRPKVRCHQEGEDQNNEAVAIPMNAAVDAVLDQLEKRKNGSLYVFPHMQGEPEGEAISRSAPLLCVMADDEWS